MTRRSPARKDIFIRRFESSVGRDNLRQALDASDDQRALALMAMLLDPAYNKHTLAKLCERVGLRYLDLFDLFRRANLSKGLLAMCSHLPQVMEDVAMDSLSRVETCAICSGTGVPQVPWRHNPHLWRCCSPQVTLRDHFPPWVAPGARQPRTVFPPRYANVPVHRERPEIRATVHECSISD